MQERRKDQVEKHRVILGRMQRGCSVQWLSTFWSPDPTDGWMDGWMDAGKFYFVFGGEGVVPGGNVEGENGFSWTPTWPAAGEYQ